MEAITVKTIFKILMVIFGLGFFIACNQNVKYKEDVSVESADVTESYDAVDNQISAQLKPDVTSNNTPKDLKIIKTANSRYQVKNIKKATNTIKQMAFKYGAYISDLRFENDQYRKEMRFTIKIPSLHFDALMDSIDVISEFTDYENITTKDVTEEYVDLQTRLNTKIEVKERYELILRKRAITVEDILATEDKLRIIQEEIESAQGRLNYLTNKVAYSTIQIDLYETVDFKAEPEVYNKSFRSKTREGLVFGWELIESILVGVIYLWPIVLFAILIVWFVRVRLRRNKKA